MSCEICGRGSCVRSFHSLEEQELYDERCEMSTDVTELQEEIQELKAEFCLIMEETNAKLHQTIRGLHKVVDDKQSRLLEAESEIARLKMVSGEDTASMPSCDGAMGCGDPHCQECYEIRERGQG